MVSTHQPTPASLRMRIAELRVVQHRVATKLRISEVRLSHILVGRKPASVDELARIAQAIEDVAAEAVA